jgi:hypothetical protein
MMFTTSTKHKGDKTKQKNLEEKITNEKIN